MKTRTAVYAGTLAALLGALAPGAGLHAEAPAQWRLIEEARFGSPGDPRTELTRVLGVEIAKDGSVLIQDEGSLSIRRFTVDGRFVEAFGRRGAGPGEFKSMTAFARAIDGTLWINDVSNNRFSVHRENGTYLRAMQASNADRLLVPLHFDAHGRIYVEVIRNPQSPSFDIAFQRREPDGTIIDTLATPSCPAPGKPVNRLWRVQGRPWPVPLVARSATLFAGDGSIWCSPGAVYAVLKLRLGSGDTLATISGSTVAQPYPKSTRDSAITVLKAALTKAGASVGDVDLDDIPTKQPAVLGLAVDDRRRLWVTVPSTGSARSQFDVYSEQGRLVATVTGAETIYRGFTPVIRGSAMYAVLRDADDVPTVVRYRIVTGR